MKSDNHRRYNAHSPSYTDLTRAVAKADRIIENLLRVIEQKEDGSFVVSAKYKQEVQDLKNFLEYR